MILEESAVSEISDPALESEIVNASYAGTDNRPAWIGAHRPCTSLPGLKNHETWALAHYEFYLNFVRDYIDRRGSILDIGCGSGQNTAMLARYGGPVIGVDRDPKAIEFSSRYNDGTGAQFVLGAFPNEKTGRTFDYIFCIETMEHIEYDTQFLVIDAALEILNPGGRMFITTPNEENPSPPHIGLWSKDWTKRVIEHVGGRLIQWGYFNNRKPLGKILDSESSHYACVLQ